jgi:hypothetical protein
MAGPASTFHDSDFGFKHRNPPAYTFGGGGAGTVGELVSVLLQQFDRAGLILGQDRSCFGSRCFGCLVLVLCYVFCLSCFRYFLSVFCVCTCVLKLRLRLMLSEAGHYL